ncbi:hypothetical protein BDM02DRAFT_3193724 [Thelephora ganbajun]|uniref:Uncharacterized protein n=1 Tax=Thelephora ganbajun TaxID=370292 RepID=A0ACB6YXM4_THEGA|nr:hypothetical protein BDM02DRAFT_3193724 [Thelephora ganbajun]
MTLENNCSFITPRNQRISHIDTRSHSKDGKMTDDAYGFTYPTMASLVDAMISQEDNEFPRRQFALGCSFDDIIWQQAISAMKNIDHTHRGLQTNDDESVLFSLLQAGLVDHQAFDLPHKWSSRSIRYSAIVADHLWSLYTTEHTRNDRLEAELHTLKGEVQLLTMRLLAVDRFSFDTNTKVNDELKKDGDRLNRHRSCLNMIADKHNASIEYLSNMSNQLEMQWIALLALCENICLCNTRSDSTEAPVMSSPSLSPEPPRDLSVGPSMAVSSAPEENMTPIPVPALGPSSRLCCAGRVVESTTTLHLISVEEEQEIEDHLVGAWQAQGETGMRRSRPSRDFHPYHKALGSRKYSRWLGVKRDLRQKLRRTCRSVDSGAGVTMMPNGTVFSCLRSSDMVGGELQLVFPLAQEDFDALLTGELSVEVRLVVVSEVARSGAMNDVDEADKADEDDGWVTDRSVAGLE